MAAKKTRSWFVEIEMIDLPTTNPSNDPGTLRALQMDLLLLAESQLGPRDTAWEILPPRLKEGIPHIFLPDGHSQSVFAFLSKKGEGWHGEGYWPTVVYELAHETVHLLNPSVRGTATNLEEGVAVEFSITAQKVYGLNPQCPSEVPSYVEAHGLVRKLSAAPLVSAREVRDCVGSLSSAKVVHLATLFPDVNNDILTKLAERFDRGTP